MSLPFFYAPDLSGESVAPMLGEETMRHMVQVLRMKVGDELALTNGRGLHAAAVVTSASKKTCSVVVNTWSNIPRADHEVTIAISPLKNPSRFEWFLEKAAENGIASIVPLICNRTERQHFKKDRWNSILISAMLQSQQNWCAVLHDAEWFTSLVSKADAEQKYIAHCLDGEKPELQQLVKKDHRSSLILIGPEGDFTPEEINSAIEKKFQPVSLGQTRLRTETAGITAAVLLTHGI
ncbi:MAG TPA: RsmE family RNA methyltransferase [Chitinophagaceae bacterium]|nr:RsmE family RNA methyltransferase [Chitinophagaceae bacterium]